MHGPSHPSRWRFVAGRRYAYVSAARGKRLSIPLSGCATDAEASARAEILTRAVTELAAAGVGDGIRELAEGLGRAREGSAELAAALADVARAVARKPAAMTVRHFAAQWMSGELHRLYPDHVRDINHTDNRVRFEKHIFRVIGDRPIGELALEDGEAVMAKLPRDLSSATRRQVSQCLVRLARLAVYPAKVLATNPFPKGFLPAIGKPKGAPFLYPKEDQKLLACEVIPLERRVVYGLLAREGMRKSELARLAWTALDLDEGTITLERTKTGETRTWVLDPGTARALRTWRRSGRAPAERVIEHLPTPRQLREDLRTAGVARAELQVRTERRTWVKIHHLRATFITLSLANGKTETWVQDRTGHTSSVMINRYRRFARLAAELELGPLAPLDEALPELRGDCENGEGRL